MQREKNVKVREVITALCKLLSALGVKAVPTAEAFRRAKFNKTDATQDMWKLLHSLLMKAFERDCACQESHSYLDSQLGFVRSALWYTGYGSWWTTNAQSCRSTNEIGSRDLLLALGWVMSSENLLESLLGEKVLELELLSSAPRAVPSVEDLMLCLSGSGVDAAGKEDVKNMQWQYGKLRLQWRNHLAAQQEQAKLTHKVFSKICSSPISETSTTSVPKSTTSSGLDEDLERIRSLNEVLEAYLEWKVVEPLFWCWMDSVIDGYLSDNCSKGLANMPFSDHSVTQSCSHNDKASRSMRHLDKMLLRLQTEFQLSRVEKTAQPLTSQDSHTGVTWLNQEQKEKVERRVAARLQGLSLANTPTAMTRGFMPYLQEPQASRSTRKPQKGDLSHEMASGKLHVSSALRVLKEKEAVLLWELELIRQSHREQIQAQASTQEGLVLIPPFKR
ncbi:tubulin epsilon and delta complex protein 1 [Pygocentrus nattereri]|uniref:Tubulin epsilon and delta complex protein 1 domain-containing protein n=1 Tax=Pygocentrus nattereri TaxID=42514 RepID=A0AAR2LHJ0_PYGNA|nr:tubulin epsilon and delta complex protein 1 [Pygocentrus nattereri]